MSAGGDSEWVDRSPKQSPAMRAAYEGLRVAEEAVAACHADGDWPAHREAVDTMVAWHHEIAVVALTGKGSA